MTQIVKDVISILEDVKAGEITNQEGLNKLDKLQKAKFYNLLLGVTGDAEQVLSGPLYIPDIDKVLKSLKGENETCETSHGWLRLDEKHLSDTEKQVLKIARKYISRLENEYDQAVEGLLSVEECRMLDDVAFDSETFPLISGIAQNLLSMSKNKEQIKYEIDFIIKNVKRFDENEFISYKIIQQGQTYTVCIM